MGDINMITNNLKNIGVFKDSCDGTIKSVFNVNNKIIEMSLLMNKDKMDVVCAPTHHFCNLKCKMCHLSDNRINKNMCPISKEYFIEALIKSLCLQEINLNNIKDSRRTKKKLLLISFMGVGEPLLNQKLILDVFKESNNIKKLLGYTDISFAIATMVPNISLLKDFIKMINENNIPLKIHFSMHTPIDENRFKLIPSSNASIEGILNELISYSLLSKNNAKIMNNYLKFHRNNLPIEIHYTLINGINDGKLELNKISNLLSKYVIPIKFIKFNPTKEMSISDNEENWITTLKEKLFDFQIKTYSPPGKEVGSSCGEFTKHYYHKEIETKEEYNEFKNWEKLHKIDY